MTSCPISPNRFGLGEISLFINKCQLDYVEKKMICYLSVASVVLISCFVIAYFTPKQWGNVRQSDCSVAVYVTNEGIHTDIIVPTKNQFFDWQSFLSLEALGRAKTTNYNYLAFGWGDRAFMLQTPPGAKINLGAAMTALFLPTPSTLHVQGYQTIPQNLETKCVKISRENYLNLVNSIKNSFPLDRQGNTIKISYGYHKHDSFYEANGTYSLLRSCNDWTADALRKAKVNTPVWSTLSSAIMLHLNSGCECNESR